MHEGKFHCDKKPARHNVLLLKQLKSYKFNPLNEILTTKVEFIFSENFVFGKQIDFAVVHHMPWLSR